jgi:para-aminobenzoate synthetase component I
MGIGEETTMTRDEMIRRMNDWGKQREPFVFVIDFDVKQPLLFPLSTLRDEELLFDIHGVSNAATSEPPARREVIFKKYPLPYEEYLKAFRVVHRHLRYGNSYLTNLTMPTRIETNLTLRELFHRSRARYKCVYRDAFVVFSPEIFVQIDQQGRIVSCPMKGTIDASIADAEAKILADPKERAEHCTIVDLIRNDLSMVAKDVTVEKFRYVEKITTDDKQLLQVSSRISGTVGRDYHQRVGSILSALLPAGSISGAPKRKTIEIIKDAEGYERGYYTGVLGVYDGETLDSGVMIRFIERIGDALYYKSGGGITIDSDPAKEYQELIDKVYAGPRSEAD